MPFVLARIFRPTILSAFELSNFELGSCFSVYGIVAMVSYLFGGALADKFKPRILMSVALLLTALGGLYMATYPSLFMMRLLFGYWGFTTIFLFWSGLIKSTRIWGGGSRQGKAFGILDGGRGLVAAGIGLIGVYIISHTAYLDFETVSRLDRQAAMRPVILFASIFVALVGVAVLIWLRLDSNETANKRNPLSYYRDSLKLPSVWLLMIIIMCAYVGYKVSDFFPQFAYEVMNYNEVESAKLGTFLLFFRPVGAVLVGIMADRSSSSIWLMISFILIIISALLIASGVMSPNSSMLFIISILIGGAGIYAARALYFSTMKEGKIPLALTGTAVGLMSLVGYTPDVFVGPITGNMLDNNPGEAGHQMIFGLLLCFALVGLVCSFLFWKLNRSTNSSED